MFCTHERPKTTNYTQAGTRQISFYAKTDASSRATKKAHYSNADGHILNSSTLNPSIIGALQIDSSIDVFFFWSKTLVWIWFRIFQLSAKRTGSQNIPRRSGGQKRHTCIEDWTPLGVKWSLPWKKRKRTAATFHHKFFSEWNGFVQHAQNRSLLLHEDIDRKWRMFVTTLAGYR